MSKIHDRRTSAQGGPSPQAFRQVFCGAVDALRLELLLQSISIFVMFAAPWKDPILGVVAAQFKNAFQDYILAPITTS